MPVEIEVHTVPHFKAPVNGKEEPRRLVCDSTFTIQTSWLKIDRLLHKLGHFDSQLLTTVHFHVVTTRSLRKNLNAV